MSSAMFRSEDRVGARGCFSVRPAHHGAVPLFWNQQGMALKPAPQLNPERTHDQNLRAIQQHLGKVTAAYGPLVCSFAFAPQRFSDTSRKTIVNLAEQHGKEGQVTNAYGDYVKELAPKDVKYARVGTATARSDAKIAQVSRIRFPCGNERHEVSCALLPQNSCC